MTNKRVAAFGAMLSFAVLLTACHSRQVDVTVENHTGAAIQQLEVDYPSASFGSNSLDANAEFKYRIQIRGNGAVMVQYSDSEGHTVKLTGSTLAEAQEGRIAIVLLPEGKAEFHPELTPGS